MTTCIECNKPIKEGIELSDGSFIHKKPCAKNYFYWVCTSDDCGMFWPYVAKEVYDAVCGECGGELKKATKKELKEYINNYKLEDAD